MPASASFFFSSLSFRFVSFPSLQFFLSAEFLALADVGQNLRQGGLQALCGAGQILHEFLVARDAPVDNVGDDLDAHVGEAAQLANPGNRRRLHVLDARIVLLHVLVVLVGLVQRVSRGADPGFVAEGFRHRRRIDLRGEAADPVLDEPGDPDAPVVVGNARRQKNVADLTALAGKAAAGSAVEHQVHGGFAGLHLFDGQKGGQASGDGSDVIDARLVDAVLSHGDHGDLRLSVASREGHKGRVGGEDIVDGLQLEVFDKGSGFRLHDDGNQDVFDCHFF
mmetsp:Transcript_103343/g.210906  ORF Transcript_103343/g.210906 Transcript_103343/m.210906 type:complete len:280 (+) Transcript_103343:103-942(+)